MNRFQVTIAAGIFAALTIAIVNPVSAANFSRIETPVSIELVQAKKDESVKQKVKRIWREWTGYKFEVACPAFPFPLTRTTCTTTGKNREEARAKCQGSNPFCTIRDSSR
jgi:hypothetical protein